jgi:hypothetical protein
MNDGGQERSRSTWIALLLVAACGRAPAPRSADSAPELVETATEAGATSGEGAPAAVNVTPVAPPPAADTSLPLAVYRAAGVPEVDQRWSAADYERCLQVFADLLRSGREDLPRQGSERSGALFARLVAPENFSPDAQPAPPAPELERYLEIFPGFLKVYSPASDGIDFSVEQASLIVALLELLKSALAESQALSARDPAWVDRYERQKTMTVGVVRGVGAMLAEETRYSEIVRHRLQSELARLAPDLERHLDVDSARAVHATAHP